MEHLESKRVNRSGNRKTVNSLTLSISKIMDFFKLQTINTVASTSPRGVGEGDVAVEDSPSPKERRYSPPLIRTAGGSKLFKSKTTDLSFKSRRKSSKLRFSQQQDDDEEGDDSTPRRRLCDSFDSVPTCVLRHTMNDLTDIRNLQEQTSKKCDKSRYSKLKRTPSEPFLNSWEYHSQRVGNNSKQGINRMISRNFLMPTADPRTNSPERRRHRARLPEILASEQLLFETFGEKSVVRAGSPLAIFEWLIFREDTDREKIIQHAFLLSYTKYVTTAELLQKMLYIFDNYDTPQKIRAVSLLKTWVESYYHRYFANNEDAIQILVYFITNHVSGISSMTANAITNFMAIQKVGIQRTLNLSQVKNEFIDFGLTDFAQQLTLVDHKIFREIKPWEFLEAAVNGGSTIPLPKSESPRDVTLVDGESYPNVRKYTAWFNKLSMWIAYEIVTTMNKKKQIEVVKRFINLAKKLQEMKNFSSLMAVLAGLNMAPVSRLKKMWKKITKGRKFLQEAENVMAPYNNFNNYRVLLATSTPPLIPLVAVHQRDLLFITDGNPSIVSHNNQKLLNFDKQIMIATTIDEMMKCQYVKYDFEENGTIQNYLKQLLHVDEKQLIKLSFLCEAPTKEQP